MSDIGQRLEKHAALLESVAGLFLAATMLLTVLDVCLRAIDGEWRIFGVIEMVQFTFDSLVFVAVAAVFLLGRNILVNLFDDFVSDSFMRIIVTSSAVITLVYMGFLLSQVIATGLEAVDFGDTTQDLQWPVVWYWIPIWVGFAVAFVAEFIHLTGHVRTGPKTADRSPRAIE
jgi:TRAP-type C4-dicarboxylate transport system permease small subunit